MRSVKAVCIICRRNVLLTVDDDERQEDVLTALRTTDTYKCVPGNHVELGSPARYLLIFWNTLEERPAISPAKNRVLKPSYSGRNGTHA